MNDVHLNENEFMYEWRKILMNNVNLDTYVHISGDYGIRQTTTLNVKQNVGKCVGLNTLRVPSLCSRYRIQVKVK